jgi:hypothetical protein
MDLGEVVFKVNHPVFLLFFPFIFPSRNPPPDFTSFHTGQALLNQEGKPSNLILNELKY